MGKAHSAEGRARNAWLALILILVLFAFYQISLRFASETHYYRAGNLFRDGYYGLSANHLKKAAHYQPNDYEIQKELGKVYLKLGALEATAKDAVLLAQRSKDFYLEALRLNPLDAETAYGLARGEVRLEQLYQYLHPEKKENPYKPLPYFKQAVSLRPNGILYHYAMARHLYRQGETDELRTIIGALARIYPSSYNYLKREDFWSPTIKEACISGLQQAIEARISLRDAHMAISSLKAEDKEWSGAISHYGKALGYNAFQNNAAHYIHMGNLYLQSGRFEDAETSFFHALEMSRSRENDLERLYHLYKKAGYPDKLYQFYQQAGRDFILSSRINIFIARSLIDLKRYNEARRILIDLNQEEPVAEAYYWLARIAKIEKDWDSMELAIQKATVLDSKNSRYHLIFSQVLKRLNKLDRAEKEAGLAIKYKARR